MTSPESVPETKPDTIVSTTFHRFNGGVLLNIPCNLCINKTLYVNNIFTLLDFGDNGSIVEHPEVKFFDGYLEGFIITIVVLDLKSGEILKRKHRISDDNLPCNWLIMSPDYFDTEDRKDELLAFEF